MVRAPKSGDAIVGTSGWTYDSWRGSFYPTGVPRKDWLSWCAGRFATTEVNGSFYRTPSLEAVRAWRRHTPGNFVFAWKASKFITHWKRLNETCVNSIALMETRLRALGHKAGPVLFQLPASFEADRERLAKFIGMLPRRRRYAFEFRHPSWYERPVFDLLGDNNISLCLADHHLAPAPWLATAQHVYVRGHGPDGRYRDHYPDETLRQWAKRIRTWRRESRTVFVYFDNDQKSAAPADARRLIDLLRHHRPSDERQGRERTPPRSAKDSVHAQRAPARRRRGRLRPSEKASKGVFRQMLDG
jgi:uncharacterized protein YecE (DUF72 family)